MTNQEALELLYKIDNGYEPTEIEKEELSSITYISWKAFKRVHKSFGKPTRLKGFDFVSVFQEQSNSLVYIPESIGNLANLQSLDLSTTQIRTLPDSIGNLMNLRRLYLNSSQICTLPDSIGNLTNLQILNLSSTKISTLPDSIGNLVSLQNLYLNSTKIRTLPKKIGSLPCLKTLVLEDDSLTELPEELLSLNLKFETERYKGLDEKSGIYINGLKLQNQPIEIFSQSRELIIEYFESITNTSHTQKGVKLSVYNGLGTKIIIMPPTTAQHMPLMALSDNSVGC